METPKNKSSKSELKEQQEIIKIIKIATAYAEDYWKYIFEKAKLPKLSEIKVIFIDSNYWSKAHSQVINESNISPVCYVHSNPLSTDSQNSSPEILIHSKNLDDEIRRIYNLIRDSGYSIELDNFKRIFIALIIFHEYSHYIQEIFFSRNGVAHEKLDSLLFKSFKEDHADRTMGQTVRHVHEKKVAQERTFVENGDLQIFASLLRNLITDNSFISLILESIQRGHLENLTKLKAINEMHTNPDFGELARFRTQAGHAMGIIRSKNFFDGLNNPDEMSGLNMLQEFIEKNK